MKNIIVIFLVFFSFSVFAQNDPNKEVKPIVEEGTELYKSEMASWYGTDLFLQAYSNRQNIGGYFSYLDNKTPKCIFFSREKKPKVIGTISFESDYNLKTADVNLKERKFSSTEQDLFEIRQAALETIQTDTLFLMYENTNLNIIPFIYKGTKKVYVLTATTNPDIVIFGNDYLITFDKKNKVKTKKKLHHNIISVPMKAEGKTEGEKIESTVHSHLPETGDFITVTDVCTLLLYSDFVDWKQHNIVSQKYLNTWNCQKKELFVITMEAIQKIQKQVEEEKEDNKE